MSLNNIQLPPQLVADLYTDVIVETGTYTIVRPVPVDFLGENGKQIVILVADSANEYLPDRELAFLTSILSACRLGMTDIAVVNCYNRQPEEFQNIFQQLDAVHIISFGPTPSDIGLSQEFPPFQLEQSGNRTFLYSPTLSEIEQQKALKTRLWAALKQMFGI